MSDPRVVTVVEEFRRSGSEHFSTTIAVPFVRLRGRWLEKLGFTPGAKVYITETPNGINLSPQPPAGASVSDTKRLSEIKAEFQKLGIETEKRVKKKKIPVEKKPFTVPTFGIANTDPMDMDDDTFNAWVNAIDPSKKERWLSLRAEKKKPEPAPSPMAAWNSKNATQPNLWSAMLPQTSAAQANVIHELPDDIPPDELQFFKPRQISVKAYEKLCNDY